VKTKNRKKTEGVRLGFRKKEESACEELRPRGDCHSSFIPLAVKKSDLDIKNSFVRPLFYLDSFFLFPPFTSIRFRFKFLIGSLNN
jgi:hypothetical protein